jgi:5-hydroxyisourate hydrolase
MSRITTHVLDTVLGKPAAGVAVRLEMQEGGGWMEVSTGGNPAIRVHDAP